MSLELESILNVSDSRAASQRNFDRIAASNALGLTIIKVDDENVYHRIGFKREGGEIVSYISDNPVLVAEEPGPVVIKVDGEELYHQLKIKRESGELVTYISGDPI